MEQVNYNYITSMDFLRLQLNTFVYNDPGKIQLLLQYINEDDLFSVTDINNRVITLKIKKMNMKRIHKSNNSNSISFYYDIFNNGLNKFLQDPSITNTIVTLGNTSYLLKDIQQYKFYLENQSCISLLYNIVAISDVSIMLYL